MWAIRANTYRSVAGTGCIVFSLCFFNYSYCGSSYCNIKSEAIAEVMLMVVLSVLQEWRMLCMYVAVKCCLPWGKIGHTRFGLRRCICLRVSLKGFTSQVDVLVTWMLMVWLQQNGSVFNCSINTVYLSLARLICHH